MRQSIGYAGVRLAAVLVLAGYGWTVWHATHGAADPVWTAIKRKGALRVGTDPGFQPFAQEQADHWQGYDVDLTTEIARRLQLRPEFVPVGYDALYDKLAAGDVDLLAAALPLAPEQGWRARFTSAYLDAGQVLVVPSTSPLTGEDHLAGRQVGAALGSDGDTLLRRIVRTQPTLHARFDWELPAGALAALEHGELDAVITDSVSALALVERNHQFKIVRGLTFEPYVMAMPLAAYQLQGGVNHILDQLRHEGFFDRLNAKWFGGQASTG
ncbi:MAG: amino acid ABC transporter substrate-binding protein [Herpetosiphonaceae bacterium]|nr:amino acid ABC transporter substrate-binding protein [Herpetosiphonaceae bacterium]